MRQWKKKFCSHKIKNLASIRTIWQDAGFVSKIPNWDVRLSKFDVDWKNIFTYADYDVEVIGGETLDEYLKECLVSS